MLMDVYLGMGYECMCVRKISASEPVSATTNKLTSKQPGAKRRSSSVSDNGYRVPLSSVRKIWEIS